MGSGGGESKVSYYDKEGSATFLFDNKVPINAVKKAFFTDKFGTIKTILKMAYNSVVYDFSKTAKNGIVIFTTNFTDWEFIAPDNQFDFAGYKNKTVGQVLENVRAVVEQYPVPAWEAFADFLYESNDILSKLFGGVTKTEISSQQGTKYVIDNLQWKTVHSFLEFIDILIKAFSPISEYDASVFMNELKIDCDITLHKSGGKTTVIDFIIRE